MIMQLLGSLTLSSAYLRVETARQRNCLAAHLPHTLQSKCRRQLHSQIWQVQKSEGYSHLQSRRVKKKHPGLSVKLQRLLGLKWSLACKNLSRALTIYSAIYRLQETEKPSRITSKPTEWHISLLLAAGAPLPSVPALALHSPELSFVFPL